MEAFLVSALVVALAEIGDRTQLLAVILASRFRAPAPVIAGIFAATLANHGLAASVGYFAADLIQGRWLDYALAASFLATAVWTLIPDKAEEGSGPDSGLGVFLTVAVAFFLVEVGDKTQIATVSLAARFRQILPVAAGTTLGMMASNIPAVLLGEAATRAVPLRLIRVGAALIFFGLGVWTLIEAIRG